jgi:capsular exopolysaccharide synthesis family protein
MRVSDALRRATEENKRANARALEEHGHPITDSRDGYSLTKVNGGVIGESEEAFTPPIDQREHRVGGIEKNDSSRSNGKSPVITSSELRSAPKRRLRERIEDLLFGRDLRELKAHSLVSLEKSPAGGQYKILREQIKKITSESGSRILAVTSPLKGDGKSTVAANLAATIALDYEQQVLVIDGDLRGPSIHQFFGVESTPGLVEYLSSDSDTDGMSYIQNTSISGLRIFTAGKPSIHSSELLAKERMKALIREIRARLPGHLIIVDTSPILSTPDPFVLAQQVDAIVMVIRAGKTPRDCLSEAIKSLGSNKVIGLILNGAELGTAAQYYYSAPSQSPVSKLDTN